MGKAVGLAVAAVVAAVLIVAAIAAAVRNDDNSGSAAGPATTTTTRFLEPSTVPLDPQAQHERDIADAWNTEADAALNGADLQKAIKDMVSGASDFAAGKSPAAEFQSTLDFTVRTFVQSRDAEASLRPFPLAPMVGDLARRSFCLYIDANRIWRVSSTMPAGDLRAQTDLTARRVRELADRTFDRAQALIEPFQHIPPDPDVVIHRAEEVPEWVVEGLAAGPPLDPVVPPPNNGSFPEREATRPTQPRAAWLAAVAAAGAPSIGQFQGLTDTGAAPSAETWGSFARGADAASETLRNVPDPATAAPLVQGGQGREDSARVRIRLEIDAEAARILQISFLMPDPAAKAELGRIVDRILATADGLWLPDLPPRASGIADSVLTQPASAL